MTRPGHYLAILMCLLLGCTSHYTFNGKRFDSQESVVAAQEENIRHLLADISPLPRSVTTRKLLFFAPGYNAIMAAQDKMDQLAGVKRNQVQRADAEIKAKIQAANYRFTANMIKKRNLYRDVAFIESLNYTVGEPGVSETEDAMYISCTYSSTGRGAACQDYYVNKKYGKQVFAFDRGSPDYRERNRAYLHAVEALAIRE